MTREDGQLPPNSSREKKNFLRIKKRRFKLTLLVTPEKRDRAEKNDLDEKERAFGQERKKPLAPVHKPSRKQKKTVDTLNRRKKS